MKTRQWVKTPHGYGRVSKVEPSGIIRVRLASSGRRFRYRACDVERIERPVLSNAGYSKALGFVATFAAD